MSVLLHTDDLTRKFGELVAVDQVSFEIESGIIKSLIGPNGAGKTTLFNCLSGTLQPTSGDIYFKGERVTDAQPHEMSKAGLGRTYQITNLFEEFTAFENIRLAAQIHGDANFDLFRAYDSLTEPKEKAHEILDVLQLADKREMLVANLSHGDKRKIEIGLAMATDSDLLLLDEPSAGMASDDITEVKQLIGEISTEYTVLLVEHNIDVVMDLSDSIMVMDQGDIIADGPPDEIRGDERVREAYLGTGEETDAELAEGDQ